MWSGNKHSEIQNHKFLRRHNNDTYQKATQLTKRRQQQKQNKKINKNNLTFGTFQKQRVGKN